MDNCSLEEARIELRVIQRKYGLSDIYIVSDSPKSWRAWCFTKVDFRTYLKILLETNYLDFNYFLWTVRNRKSTLRITDKPDRERQEMVCVLESYPAPLPDSVIWASYDTLREKGLKLTGAVV
jgi:hypothetical protein